MKTIDQRVFDLKFKLSELENDLNALKQENFFRIETPHEKFDKARTLLTEIEDEIETKLNETANTLQIYFVNNFGSRIKMEYNLPLDYASYTKVMEFMHELTIRK